MEKIYKYELEITNLQSVSMPIGANVISANVQNGKLCIWALVDTRNSDKNKSIAVAGTGYEIDFTVSDYDFYFVDTVMMSDILVLHVYAHN